MSIINIIVIAIALAMDAFAVSIAVGMKLKKINGRQIFRLSWHFGLFQALMPLIGWSAGFSILPHIERFDHWVAFVLLFLVGANMMREALSSDSEEDEQQVSDPTKGANLVILSVATSIDALAVGFSISMLNAPIVFPAIIIGLVAGAGTIAGMYIGRSLGAIPRISTIAEIIGGLVLWCIGINILIDHGVFHAFL